MNAPAVDALSFEELARLEPQLHELEERVRAIRDPGGPRFFCSNYLWLPLSVELRGLVGVGRRGWSTHEEGDPLYDSRAYETAYRHLSALLPPCRDCGCHRFERLGR